MSDTPYPPGRRVRGDLRPRPTKIRVIAALVLREMSSRYGSNPGGYFWALVEPLGMILVLSIGFSLLLRTPPLGDSFLMFYTTGFLPFSMFMKTSVFIQIALRISKPLFNYPVVSWFDVVVARAITNGLTLCMVAVILFTAMLLYLPGVQSLDPVPIAQAFFAAFVLGVGIGLMNGVLSGFFPVWESFWNIATAPLFILSGVIWIYEDLPQMGQNILYWNPLLHILGLSRSGFFPTYDPQYVNMLYVWGLALGCLVMGLFLMRRFHRDILQNR